MFDPEVEKFHPEVEKFHLKVQISEPEDEMFHPEVEMFHPEVENHSDPLVRWRSAVQPLTQPLNCPTSRHFRYHLQAIYFEDFS